MAKIRIIAGNTKPLLKALEMKIRSVLENDEDITLFINNDLELLTVITTVLDFLKKNGRIKQEDIDRILELKVVKDGEIVEGKVTKEGIEPDVWSCINSELLSKFVELIQLIENDRSS